MVSGHTRAGAARDADSTQCQIFFSRTLLRDRAAKVHAHARNTLQREEVRPTEPGSLARWALEQRLAVTEASAFDAKLKAEGAACRVWKGPWRPWGPASCGAGRPWAVRRAERPSRAQGAPPTQSPSLRQRVLAAQLRVRRPRQPQAGKHARMAEGGRGHGALVSASWPPPGAAPGPAGGEQPGPRPERPLVLPPARRRAPPARSARLPTW